MEVNPHCDTFGEFIFFSLLAVATVRSNRVTTDVRNLIVEVFPSTPPPSRSGSQS